MRPCRGTAPCRGTTLWIVIGLVLVQAGCGQDLTWTAVRRAIESAYPKVPAITTDSLARRLADPTLSAPVLLDARTPEEYAVSHLKGAVRVDPSAKAFPALDTLSRRAPIVVYCSVGYRSAGVAERLRKAGFVNVSNLKGSIFRWANEGRPVYREGKVVREVHPYDRLWGRLLKPVLRTYQLR